MSAEEWMCSDWTDIYFLGGYESFRWRRNRHKPLRLTSWDYSKLYHQYIRRVYKPLLSELKSFGSPLKSYPCENLWDKIVVMQAPYLFVGKDYDEEVDRLIEEDKNSSLLFVDRERMEFLQKLLKKLRCTDVY